jgi:hypothetical protein
LVVVEGCGRQTQEKKPGEQEVLSARNRREEKVPGGPVIPRKKFSSKR